MCHDAAQLLPACDPSERGEPAGSAPAGLRSPSLAAIARAAGMRPRQLQRLARLGTVRPWRAGRALVALSANRFARLDAGDAVDVRRALDQMWTAETFRHATRILCEPQP